jgi:hypothetical protein
MTRHSRNRSLAVALALCGALAWPGAGAAETIRLKNGRTIDGVVLERRDGKVIVLASGGRLELPESSVESIEEAAGEDASATRVALLLRAGNFDGALIEAARVFGVQPPGSAPFPPAAILATLDALSREEEFVGKALARKPASDSARALEALAAPLALADAASAAAEDGSTGRWSAARYRAALSRWLWRAGRANDALDALEPIPAAYFAAAPTVASDVATQLLDTLWRSLRSRDDIAAERALALLAPADETVARAARAMYAIERGARYRESGDFARALSTYREDLFAEAPTLSRHFTAQTLVEAYQRMRGTGDGDALLELLGRHGAEIFGKEETMRLMATVLEELGRDALAEGRSQEALAYFRRVSAARGDSVEPFLALAELARRRVETAEDDWMGRYRLGVYCAGVGLLSDAEAEFDAVVDGGAPAELKSEARRELTLIDRQREIGAYERVHHASEAGRYYDTLDLAVEFARRFPRSDFQEDVSKIAEHARREIENSHLRRPYEAEVQYQEAERLFYEQKPEEALATIDRLLQSYADTPAAERASALKRRVAGRFFARDLEAYLRALRRSRLDDLNHLAGDTSADPLANDPAGQAEAQALRDEVAFIARTIGSRLPEYGGLDPATENGATP